MLGRPWLWAVNAIVYYGRNEYWIRNDDGIENVLRPSKLSTPGSSPPQVRIREEVNDADLPYEPYTLASIAISNEGRIDTLLQRIKEEAEQQADEDEEYYNEVEDVDDESEDEESLKVPHL